MTAYRAVAVSMLVLLAAALSCFNPSFKDDIACGPGGACPSGLACGADNVCRAGGGAVDAPVIDAPLPIDSAVVDAPVDAAPVQCTGNQDCLTPPSLCQRPGVCDLATSTCTFANVDCSGMSNACNAGTCDVATGACVATPTNEDQLCGAGDTCGAFGPCGSFGQECDSSGTQSRNCTRNACRQGTCVATARTDTAACTRMTEGVDCGTDTTTNCGACGGFTPPCDETGTRACTCTDFKCRSDVCTAAPTTCMQACSRDTDGTACGPATTTDCGNCFYDGFCDEETTMACTCNALTCMAEQCVPSSSSCAVPCTRDRDGQNCTGGACTLCAPGQGGQFHLCVDDACRPGPCGAC